MAGHNMASKVALVTGGARGIGRAIADMLLRRGAQVAFIDVQEEQGRNTEQELADVYGGHNVYFIRCDVTSGQEFEDAFRAVKQKFGNIDIVCNNAGIYNEVHWEKMIAINLGGVMRGSLLAIEHMGRHRGGRGGVVINTSSANGIFPAFCGASYTASKYGIVGFTRSLGEKLGPELYGVRVNCFCPSGVYTNLTDGTLDHLDPHIHQMARTFVRRLDIMTPEAVAECLLPLIQDEGLSGEVMLVIPGSCKLVDFPKTEEELKTKTSNQGGLHLSASQGGTE